MITTKKRKSKKFLENTQVGKICNCVVQNYPVLMWYKKQTKEKQQTIFPRFDNRFLALIAIQMKRKILKEKVATRK